MIVAYCCECDGPIDYNDKFSELEFGIVICEKCEENRIGCDSNLFAEWESRETES